MIIRLSKSAIVLCFLAVYSFGTIVQNGLILYSGDFHYCCIYVPLKGFRVYDKPNGQRIGRLTRNVKSNRGNRELYSLYFVDKQHKEHSISTSDLFYLSNEHVSIPFVEQKDEFVRIINADYNYWVSVDEIYRKGFDLISWYDFLSNYTGDVLGLYALDTALPLKTEPNDQAQTIQMIESDLYNISLLEQGEGGWARVSIEKYKEHPCSAFLDESELIEYTLEGWMKVLDDDGLPLLDYYAEGC